ncbi:MAG: arsenite methyltransferase [Chloroflexi bacterium]|nr:arsenite methyltransferase [Chloroflexota bacterium]
MLKTPDTIRSAVREHYADAARKADSCCGPSDCGCGPNTTLYDDQLLTGLPSDVANFSLGCGDPISLAALQPGETALDLGSGGGLDCFLAAKQVGETGRVIGVDMTPEMLKRARAAAERLSAANVEFRQGYLESLPLEDSSIDAVISNCVINLSPDKPQVFREIFRVLKPGGRIAVSDIVTNGPLPQAVQNSMEQWGACVAGALDVKDYTRGLTDAGFADVRLQPKGETDKALAMLPVGVPFSAAVTAVKPG